METRAGVTNWASAAMACGWADDLSPDVVGDRRHENERWVLACTGAMNDAVTSCTVQAAGPRQQPESCVRMPAPDPSQSLLEQARLLTWAAACKPGQSLPCICVTDLCCSQNLIHVLGHGITLPE